MSRVAKTPVVIPIGVEVKLNNQIISIKNNNNTLIRTIHKSTIVKKKDNILTFYPHKNFTNAWSYAGTTRALIHEMIIGVTIGFTKTLQLVGVGYRVGIQGNIVNLALGFSHLIEHSLPSGVTAICPSQTEIILRGTDKQIIGQIAADLRAYRRPEPYKGKGIRYANENLRTKEAKKK
ncbi:50S ribosomal protein L6 [Candidatus Ecksteinia adelgidicola]|nr:50S ribosomal protein L6 [Candidatus Ecksteinia adelgidicola]